MGRDRQGGNGKPRPRTGELQGVGASTTVELREERLVPEVERAELGEIEIRTVIEEVPGRVEVELARDEVEIEHEPGGEAVTQRMAPYEQDGDLIVPVYEEQLVVVKKLVLKERLRIRRVGVKEQRVFDEMLKRERVVISDPNDTGLVIERFPAPNRGKAR